MTPNKLKILIPLKCFYKSSYSLLLYACTVKKIYEDNIYNYNNHHFNIRLLNIHLTFIYNNRNNDDDIHDYNCLNTISLLRFKDSSTQNIIKHTTKKVCNLHIQPSPCPVYQG